ncbi:MAG: SGNH/GDSL hydrolase family protein [Gammaproteobacteria bacterium]|nr:SGNH/GDSL hydrolase family protein [Gammaproteobacteria bacterium]
MYLKNKFNVFLFVMGSLFMASVSMAVEDKMPDNDINVVLVGASIGNGWKFDELAERVDADGFNLEFVAIYDSFDKSSAIDELISRNELPDVVIIKECSVYFPGDIADYKKKITQWTAQLAEKNIDVVFATSVPVSEQTGLTSKIKSVIKGVMGKPNKMKQLTAYNDWLREVAEKQGLAVLDLEAALRVSNENRYMDPKYDRGDHVHLNPEAYKALDQVGGDFLSKIKADRSEK